MAFGAIELTTISRAQDYSTIKQNEDNKAQIDQGNGMMQVQKHEQQQTKEVHRSDDVQWHEKKPDAREKGNGEYNGDGGRRRSKNSREQVVTKGKDGVQHGFDIKI